MMSEARWSRSYDDVRNYPNCDFFETKQKELWNELLNLENGDYLCVYYLCHIDFIEISLTEYKDWAVTYYQPFKEPKFYHAVQKAFERSKIKR